MNQDYKKASFWERLGAFIIDMTLLAAPLFGIYSILQATSINLVPALYILVGVVLIIVYSVFLVARTGSTIGEKFLKLKTVDVNYGNINLKRTLIRETVGKFISLVPLGFGAVYVLYDENRQAWHDKLAGTFVVKTNNEGGLLPSSGQDRPKPVEKIIFYLFSALIIIFIISGLFYNLIGYPMKVVGNSMAPTYKNGQIIIIRPLSKISRSDVILADVVIDGAKGQLLRRVIPRGGEIIMLKNSQLYINGNLLNQSRVISKNVKTPPGTFIEEGEEYIIPQGYYFVLGDSREVALDSRNMGFVPLGAIVGKASACLLNCR